MILDSHLTFDVHVTTIYLKKTFITFVSFLASRSFSLAPPLLNPSIPLSSPILITVIPSLLVFLSRVLVGYNVFRTVQLTLWQNPGDFLILIEDSSLAPDKTEDWIQNHPHHVSLSKQLCSLLSDQYVFILQPSPLYQLFSPVLRAESSVRLVDPRSRTITYGEGAFSVWGPRIWNALPANIRSSNSLSQFKSALKTHFFRLAYEWVHRLRL